MFIGKTVPIHLQEDTPERLSTFVGHTPDFVSAVPATYPLSILYKLTLWSISWRDDKLAVAVKIWAVIHLDIYEIRLSKMKKPDILSGFGNQ